MRHMPQTLLDEKISLNRIDRLIFEKVISSFQFDDILKSNKY